MTTEECAAPLFELFLKHKIKSVHHNQSIQKPIEGIFFTRLTLCPYLSPPMLYPVLHTPGSSLMILQHSGRSRCRWH